MHRTLQITFVDKKKKKKRKERRKPVAKVQSPHVLHLYVISRDEHDLSRSAWGLLLLPRDETWLSSLQREDVEARTTSRWKVYCYYLVMKHNSFVVYFVQCPRSRVNISKNTPISLEKSKLYLQFRNVHPAHGSGCNMHGYMLAYSRLCRENLWALRSKQLSLKFLRTQHLPAGTLNKKTKTKKKKEEEEEEEEEEKSHVSSQGGNNRVFIVR